VLFDPKVNGIVDRFQIVSVTPEEKNGDRVTKTVTITAPVTLPTGGSVEKKLVIAMERQNDRWIITGMAAFQK
jgi:hypothetical protein